MSRYLLSAIIAIRSGHLTRAMMQVTRVLIERLIVNKPHPWGLLITFIELIKNPIYDFWRHDFVRSSKEIEQLFLSVARFCGASASPQASEVGATGNDASTA